MPLVNLVTHDLIFQSLPGQLHCYFLSDPPSSVGAMVSSVYFSHPCDVQSIVAALRTQATFNAVVKSCVRPNAAKGRGRLLPF